VVWEQGAKRLLAAGRAPADLADELAARSSHLFVASLTQPSSAWFDGDVVRSRDRLLLDALTAAVDELAMRRSSPAGAAAWGALHTTTFVHPLGVTDATRRRYSIGPFARSGYADTVLSTSGRGLEASVGASFSAVFDVGNWDASVVQNPPGQSESPASPHAADLAPLWAAGRPVPLVFSADALRRNEESTLTLLPRSPAPRR
jgi:penicillin amidase